MSVLNVRTVAPACNYVLLIIIDCAEVLIVQTRKRVKQTVANDGIGLRVHARWMIFEPDHALTPYILTLSIKSFGVNHVCRPTAPETMLLIAKNTSY